jgi:exopolysaccharide biosynthesis polyprenyl glycosylphosphotransferase
MLKQQARFLALSVFVLDLLLVAGAFLFAHYLRSSLLPILLPGFFPGQLYPVGAYLRLLPLPLFIWGSLLLLSGRYRSHRTVPLIDEAWEIIRVSVTATVIFAMLFFALRLDESLLPNDRVSRIWVLLFGLLSCLFLLSEKLALRVTSRYARSRGLNYRTVLIIGTNDSALAVAESILSHRYWGFRILGFIDTQTPTQKTLTVRGAQLAVVGSVSDVPRLVQEDVVDDVFFAVSRQQLDRLEGLSRSLQEQGIRTRFVLDLVPRTNARIHLEELDGLPLLSVSPGPTNPFLLVCKRALDLSLSVLLLVLSLPIVVAIATLVKITSSGGVLYRQTRCGLNGRRFTLYKFRTMIEGAEDQRGTLLHLNEMNGPAFKLRQDPRVTRFGRFLRKFSLDELPQLWNVVKGDMSLVGPRPPIPEEVAQYQRWQRRRLAMKPGLTCLWQISGRNNVDFDRWMELDLEYIDSWSPLLDLKILLKTIPVVLSGRGAS